MRPNFLKSSVAVWVCATFSGAPAIAADWNGSYSASGECYCVGDLPNDVRSTIVPTPIGGQAISQVCERVGQGPALSLVSGVFNHPVYPDAQCGNGPFSYSIDAREASCVGSLDGNAASQSCQSAGPQWNLTRAFSKNNSPEAAAAKPAMVRDTHERVQQASGRATATLLDKPVVSSLTLESTNSVTKEKETVKTTIIRSASTAGKQLNTPQSMGAFSGKKVNIEGQRYLQAHAGIPANGGNPGSRIVLDGFVFLRDDGSINPVDLLREKPVQLVQRVEKKAEPAVAAALAKPRETVKPTIAENQAKIDEQALVAAKLRLEHEAYQKAHARYAAELVEKERLALAAETAAIEAAEAEKTGSDSLLVTGAEREQKQLDSVAETARQVEPPGQTGINVADSTVAAPITVSALRLPKKVRASSRNFSYLEALPVSYDVGGNGLLLEGSAASHSRFQYVGRVGVTADYQELMVGGGYFLTPQSADRLTVVLLAGIEYGNFELTDSQTPAIAVDFDDSGFYVAAETRMVINNKFELKAGVGYGSFFEGDASVFGGGYYHINKKLDLVTRFEVGDNDLLGIGVRFYY